MSLRINTNVAALNAYNNLSANQTRLESSFQQLSSGLRINKAADDAAGLSIAQGLTSQINGLTQAVSNANDGINVAQIADGALGTTQDILQRMRGLIVKAGNEGTQDSNSLGAIKQEITNLNTQMDNISTQTKFGQTNLLDGTYNKNFQVGSNGGETILLDLSSADVTSATLATDQLGIATAVPSTGVAATPATNSGEVVAGTAASGIEGDLAAHFGALDGSGSGDFTLVDQGNGVFQVQGYITGGGSDSDVLGTASIDSEGVVTLSGGTNPDTVLGTPSVEAGILSYTTTDAAADLTAMDAAIKTVSDARSQIGAVQNQLGYTVTNLQTTITNVTASKSNLMDADLAQQVTEMTQSQILTQAATAVLAQANSAPQAILQLLQ